ncbi:MAG: hypothetical protein K5744_09235 [Eubacterium sp.]|nr:hypothetical protein [Eubacterium sp.]
MKKERQRGKNMDKINIALRAMGIEFSVKEEYVECDGKKQRGLVLSYEKSDVKNAFIPNDDFWSLSTYDQVSRIVEMEQKAKDKERLQYINEYINNLTEDEYLRRTYPVLVDSKHYLQLRQNNMTIYMPPSAPAACVRFEHYIPYQEEFIPVGITNGTPFKFGPATLYRHAMENLKQEVIMTTGTNTADDAAFPFWSIKTKNDRNGAAGILLPDVQEFFTELFDYRDFHVLPLSTDELIIIDPGVEVGDEDIDKILTSMQTSIPEDRRLAENAYVFKNGILISK